jgi:hypothetical protein
LMILANGNRKRIRGWEDHRLLPHFARLWRKQS